jgi:hypothetical protein
MEFGVHIHQIVKSARDLCNYQSSVMKEKARLATIFSQLNFSMNEVKTKEEELIGIYLYVP